MVVGLGIAGLGIIAKSMNFIDFGFYGNGTATTAQPENNSKIWWNLLNLLNNNKFTSNLVYLYLTIS